MRYKTSLKIWVRLLRVKQWLKNGLVFAPLLFSQKLTDPDSFMLAIAGFVAFCIVASGIYIINDLKDAPSDLKHPVKKYRPIANGDISKTQALLIAISMLVLGAIVSASINFGFMLVLMFYAIVTLTYTFYFKRVVMLDVIMISVGFVLRAIGGAVAIGVVVSNWLLVTTFYLALFMVLGKRRNELLLLGDGAGKHRKILGEYSQTLLDQLMMIAVSASLVSYSLYTLSPTTIAHFGSENLIFTLPFVIYGLFRYLYLVYKKDSGGDPGATLYTDLPLIVDIVLWAMSVIAIIYLT